MSASKKMIKVSNNLEKLGHVVILPESTKQYVEGKIKFSNSNESSKHKQEQDLIRIHYKKIDNSDAILVINVEKNQIKNYIGGNSFIELAFGHILNKKLFLLNPIPDISYRDEIKAMEPIVINGDLSKIK